MTTETIDLSETPTRVPSTRNCTREIRGSVLDVGCGTGENALYLAALGHEMLGIDSARRRLRRRGVSHFNANSKQIFDWSMGWNYLAWGRGEAQAGDKIERFDRDGIGITVEDIVRLYAFEQGDLEMLRRAVQVMSLPKSWRDYYRHQLKERGG